MTLIADAPLEITDLQPGTDDLAGTTPVLPPAVGWAVNPEPTFQNSAGLTVVEATVLRMAATGVPVSAMQHTLLLPEETVVGFLQGAYRRIGATDRTEALAWALAEGLLTPVVLETSAGLTGSHAA